MDSCYQHELLDRKEISMLKRKPSKTYPTHKRTNSQNRTISPEGEALPVKKNFSGLRQRAEGLLANGTITPEKISFEEAARLIHELQVHQIELEIQNEDLRQTQMELAESARKYSELFDFAPAGHLTVNRLGEILEANLQATVILGRKKSHLLGHFFPALIMESEERRKFRRVLVNNDNHEKWQGDFRIRDGKGKPRTLLVNLLFTLDAKGEEIYWLALTDITERKRAEEALRESEARFRTLIRASSEVMYRMSPDWTEMRELTGGDFLSDTDTPSQAWLEKYIFPEDQPHVLAVINEAIRTKGLFELEHRVRRVDGSVGWTFSRATPILDANREIIEWFGAAKDITARKEAEAALQESQQKLGWLTSQLLTTQEQERERIARDLHDEMGQSLMVLKMQLNSFKRRFNRGQEAWDEFNQAVDSINVIAEQIRQTCHSLRPEALENLGLNKALQQLLMEVKQFHGLEISEELADTSGLLSSEAQITVYRLFQECLTNAIRHGQATRVTVRAHKGEDAILFGCEDNGSGFDLKEVRSRGKSGLGLTAMEERVRLLQGSLKITSAEGKGTRIEVILPPNQD
jgi:PAS domain S-box-containing protein